MLSKKSKLLKNWKFKKVRWSLNDTILKIWKWKFASGRRFLLYQKKVTNEGGPLTDNNTKLGPIKKKTKNLSEIVPAVDDSSPGAVRENKIIIKLKIENR